MFKNFKWFLKYAKRNYIIGSISLLVSDIISLFLPYVTGQLIDMVYNNTLTMNNFKTMILISFILIILKYVTAMAWSYNIFKASSMMEYLSRDKLMDKFLKQSQRFYENNPTGSLMSKSTQDVSQVAQFAGFGVLAFFDAVLFPIFIIIMMIVTIDFKMTVYAIIPYFVLAFGYYKLMDKIYNRSRLVNKSFDELTDSVLEDVEGIRIIRVYNIGKLRAKRFMQKTRELADRYVNLVKIQALIEPFEIFITSISYAIAVGYGAYLVSQGDLSVGKIVSFTYYLGMLIWPMFALGEFLNLSQQASAAMDRIVEILNYKEEISNTDDYDSIDPNPSISFVNHNYKYPTSENDILINIDLSIENGTSLGIVGKTGSGDSDIMMTDTINPLKSKFKGFHKTFKQDELGLSLSSFLLN